MKGAHKGKGWYVRFGPAGQSDILGLIPPHGRFLAIEVKRGGQGPTDDQLRFINRVNKAGGLAFVAYSLEDCQRRIAQETVETQVRIRTP